MVFQDVVHLRGALKGGIWEDCLRLFVFLNAPLRKRGARNSKCGTSFVTIRPRPAPVKPPVFESQSLGNALFRFEVDVEVSSLPGILCVSLPISLSNIPFPPNEHVSTRDPEMAVLPPFPPNFLNSIAKWTNPKSGVTDSPHYGVILAQP